jgi:hypothetical protein
VETPAQVVVWAAGSNVLGGDGSTVSLWLGLGVGLLVVENTPDEPEWPPRPVLDAAVANAVDVVAWWPNGGSGTGSLC